MANVKLAIILVLLASAAMMSQHAAAAGPYPVPKLVSMNGAIANPYTGSYTNLRCLSRWDAVDTQVLTLGVCYSTDAPDPVPPPPPPPYGLASPQELSGSAGQNGEVHLPGCLSFGAGQYFAWDTIAVLDKTGSVQSSEYRHGSGTSCSTSVSEPFSIVDIPDWETHDEDGDGCPDWYEVSHDTWYDPAPSELNGGRRDPFNPFDYMNPSHDGLNRIDDILAVVDQYFQDQYLPSPPNPPNTPNPAYNPDTDRTLIGVYPWIYAWNLGPPNGLQRIDDILHAINQYFHDCP